MVTKAKPIIQEHIYLDGSCIGAIMLDSKGYFYRPKKSAIGRAAHNPKWDGEHFKSICDVKAIIFPAVDSLNCLFRG